MVGTQGPLLTPQPSAAAALRAPRGALVTERCQAGEAALSRLMLLLMVLAWLPATFGGALALMASLRHSLWRPLLAALVGGGRRGWDLGGPRWRRCRWRRCCWWR